MDIPDQYKNHTNERRLFRLRNGYDVNDMISTFESSLRFKKPDGWQIVSAYYDDFGPPVGWNILWERDPDHWLTLNETELYIRNLLDDDPNALTEADLKNVRDSIPYGECRRLEKEGLLYESEY